MKPRFMLDMLYRGILFMETKQAILLIDDEPDLLDNLSLTLEMAGYQTLTATDGIEAIKVLKNQPVGLILSDISMPCMDGYQLHDKIRENPEWVDIPFIFLTGCRLIKKFGMAKRWALKNISPNLFGQNSYS
jgi:CheY-like chemotaxis protein